MNTAQDLNWENDFDMRFGRDSYDNTETILDSTAKREDILDFIRTLLAEQEKKQQSQLKRAINNGFDEGVDWCQGRLRGPREDQKRTLMRYGLAEKEEGSHD